MHYRQILIKSKCTRSLNIGISSSQKKDATACRLAVLKYDRLISYLFVCYSTSQQTVWLRCAINLIQRPKPKQPLAYWPHLWTNINWILMFCSKPAPQSTSHSDIDKVTTLKMNTLKKKILSFIFWGIIALHYWDLGIATAPHTAKIESINASNSCENLNQII